MVFFFITIKLNMLLRVQASSYLTHNTHLLDMQKYKYKMFIFKKFQIQNLGGDTMKKSLSLMLATMLLITMCSAVPVAAESAPAEVAEDYVAGAVTGNVITKYPTGSVPSINNGAVSAGLSGTSGTLKATREIPDTNWGLCGFLIDNKFMDAQPTFDTGDNVIFACKVKNDTGISSSKINVVHTRTTSTYIWPNAYPSDTDGFVVTGNDWVDFKTIATVPSDKQYDTYRYLVMGFAEGTAANTKILFDMPSMYFGKEYAHDIKMTVNGTASVEAGSGATISADVDILNQLGDKYSTQGTFNWYALDETRTEIVPGITITPGADGVATVDVGASVPAGNYVVAVQSVENPQMVKSFSIEVGVKDWTDHTPITVDSWYNNPVMNHNWSGHLNGSAAVSIGEGTAGTTITSTSVITNHGETRDRLMGAYLSDGVGNASGNPSAVYPSGTKFLISFKVRNLTPEKTAKVNAAMYSGGGLYSITPDAYPSIAYEDCFVIVGSDWNEYKAIITMPSSMALNGFTMDIGYPSGTEEGTVIEIDNSSFYFAPYKACDIKITVNGESASLDPGIASLFTADIVDQTGNTMDGDESFEWALVNEQKTARVQGVTFTPDATDSSTVNVVADKTVAPGNYYLTAESKASGTSGWIKSIPVTVLKPTIHDYVAGTIPGVIDDITITRTDAGSQTMGLTDTATFLATVVDGSDVLVPGEQEFVWFVTDETRKENVTSEFTITPSNDTTTATVTPKLTTANGTYYVMAQYADDEEIVKAIKIIIDKAQSVGNGANLINNGTSADISAQLSDLAVIVEVSAELQAVLAENTGVVKAETAEILAATFGDTTQLPINNMSAVTEAIEAATVIALYNENPASVTLYDAEGRFEYEDELKLSDIDTNGVSLYNVFNTILSNEGRKAMQDVLSEGGHTTIDSFTKTLKEHVVLYGVKYPDELGISYLADILTEKNLESAGISAPKYVARADKSATHMAIARVLYTVETLTDALEAEAQSEQGGTGGNTPVGGGSFGGGGGASAPIQTGTSKDDKTDEENNKDTTPKFPKFKDVSEEHWAYSDIYYLREGNIINGIDENTFNPNGNITREQFAKILCAALEIKTTDTNTSFADVDSNAWYAPYISAILNQGIVTGVDAENFGIGENITRQDLCTMIYRAIDNEKLAYTALGFTDDESISDYARDAVATLKGLEIVNGYENGSFNPKGLCTRAEAAKIICKLLAMQEVLK